MYCVTHAVVGGMTAGTAGNPLAAFLGGVISHLILDAVPHHDYKTVAWGIFDFVLALGIALFSFRQPELFPGCFFPGALGGALPDLEVAIHHLSGKRFFQVFPSHTGLTPHRGLDRPAAFWWQALLVVVVCAAWRLCRFVAAGGGEY